MLNILCSHIQMDTFQNDKCYENIRGIQTKKKKWKQVVYVKGNVSILMVQGVVPKNTNILCTHK